MSDASFVCTYSSANSFLTNTPVFCFWQVVLNKVLLLGSQTQTIIGRPILPDAAVHAVVEEHVRKFRLYLYFFDYRIRMNLQNSKLRLHLAVITLELRIELSVSKFSPISVIDTSTAVLLQALRC